MSLHTLAVNNVIANLVRHRPRASVPGSNTATKPSRIYAGTGASLETLTKPFKCPGSATARRASDKPQRKRRKVNYAEEVGATEDGDNKAWISEDRMPLANRDINKFPVYKVKDKETMFRQRFSIPLINKNSGSYDSGRPAPLLGMRRGATFVVKPLHDPSGEFAIVLYDPTVDDKPEAKAGDDQKKQEEAKPKLDEPLIHKSLAELLGIKKNVEERPKVPVVIDPRLAKVLRPHQVEGVKVRDGNLLSSLF